VSRSRLRPAMRGTALALVAPVVLAGFLVAFLVAWSHTTSALLERPVTVKRALSTTAALFGDRVEAEVDVYTDDRTVDPGSVRVRTDFTPYRAVTTRVDRTSHAGLSLLRTRIVLTCLTQACLPPRTGGRVLHFAPLAVSYRASAKSASVEVPWGPLQVLSRLPADPAANVGVVDTAPALDPSFPRSPALLRGALIGAAALLGLAGAALVVTGLWPSNLPGRRRRPISPLEQSLLEVETAAQREDEPRRRHALDQLATRLAELPSPSLEARTRSLAWGPDTPEPQAITHLTDEVRASVNGGSRR